MRIRHILLSATLLTPLFSIAADPVANLRPQLEADYQADLAVCGHLSKNEISPCKKEAAQKKKLNYAAAWKARNPAAQTRIYYGNLDNNKPKINQDYQTDIAFCKELGKVDLAICQREALERKKLAIKSLMISLIDPKASSASSIKAAPAASTAR